MDYKSFIYGYIFCMIADVIFSIANHFIEKAFYYRKLKKQIKSEDK